MSDTNDAGGTAGGGQNNDVADQNQGGDGKNTTGGASSSSGRQSQDASASSGSEKTFTQADVDRILAERLGRTKQQHEADLAKARENAAKPLQQQLDDLRKDLADRDAKDVVKAGRLALSSVKTLLAEQGIKADDVKDILGKFDPVSLLKDGEPDEAEIAKFARGLARVAGRPTPDPDQGENGSGSSPRTMGDVMRDMARNRR